MLESYIANDYIRAIIVFIILLIILRIVAFILEYIDHNKYNKIFGYKKK